MFGGETALSAGLIRHFLPGAFFLSRLPVAPGIGLEPGKKKPLLVRDRQRRYGVAGPCAICAMAPCAMNEAMRYQVGYCVAQGVLTAEASRLAPLEGGVQMPVVVLGELARQQVKQCDCREGQVGIGRAIYHPMLNGGVWVLGGSLGGHYSAPTTRTAHTAPKAIRPASGDSETISSLVKNDALMDRM